MVLVMAKRLNHANCGKQRLKSRLPGVVRSCTPHRLKTELNALGWIVKQMSDKVHTFRDVPIHENLGSLFEKPA
jgi:hypothetical protein